MFPEQHDQKSYFRKVSYSYWTNEKSDCHMVKTHSPLNCPYLAKQNFCHILELRKSSNEQNFDWVVGGGLAMLS